MRKPFREEIFRQRLRMRINIGIAFDHNKDIQIRWFSNLCPHGSFQLYISIRSDRIQLQTRTEYLLNKARQSFKGIQPRHNLIIFSRIEDLTVNGSFLIVLVNHSFRSGQARFDKSTNPLPSSESRGHGRYFSLETLFPTPSAGILYLSNQCLCRQGCL